MNSPTTLHKELQRAEADLVLLDRVSLRLAPDELATAVATARDCVSKAFHAVGAGAQDAAVQVESATQAASRAVYLSRVHGLLEP